jgi:predicted TIM-barrel fold metal-dependent hydrolase
MIIDAHTHLFSLDLDRYPLADPNSAYRPVTDGTAERLRAQMDGAGVDRALNISPWFYGWDMSYALDALSHHRSWLAVGVLVDAHDPEAPRQLERYVREHGVSGLRIQGSIFNLGRFDDPATTPLWSKAAEMGITVDANATLDEYPQVEQRAVQFPELRIVLDHCGYISGNLAPEQPNLAPVLAMARHPNVYAKLTFLAMPSRQEYPFADAHWMVREIVSAFGADRCLYGSNFPTVQYNSKMTYRQTVQLFSEAIDLTDEERVWILGGTAARLWHWGT